MGLRPATDDDWYVFTGQTPPKAWFGYVYENDFMILGLGGFFSSLDGRWWMTFRRAPGARQTKSAHTAALRLVALAAEAGITLHALADDRVDGAQKWIERLGFRATEEQIEGYTVWALS
jgi:hypothetical protein